MGLCEDYAHIQFSYTVTYGIDDYRTVRKKVLPIPSNLLLRTSLNDIRVRRLHCYVPVLQERLHEIFFFSYRREAESHSLAR